MLSVTPAAVAVAPEPGSDHSLGVSPFSARTRAWYCVRAVSVPIVVLVPVPPWPWSSQFPSVPARYCTA